MRRYKQNIITNVKFSHNLSDVARNHDAAHKCGPQHLDCSTYEIHTRAIYTDVDYPKGFVAGITC